MDMGISGILISVRGIKNRHSTLEIDIWDRKGSVIIKSDDTELIRLIVHHFKRQKFTVAEDTPTIARIFRRS